jgi:flagellar biosynthesis protein FlhA
MANQDVMSPDLSRGGGLGNILKQGDMFFAAIIIGILLVLLFPVPTILLDFLLTISITVSVLILMTCLFISKPLDLSVFPTLLLVTAVMRLALNIASTRLILANGHTGPQAAGKVIEAFGHFVMEGNLVIGIIIFAILTIINFVVITKGSGRIAEVAARFSLDAMPGKQMAIDADLSSGLIDETTAKKRRKDLEDESTFFGAMDGANKFVRGDAVAGLLIIFINLIAGIIIGVAQRDMSFADASLTYTILTIGDGLVSQIPALVVSLAAGLLVSKSGVVGSTEKAVFGQISRHPKSFAICTILLVLMACMPGIPAAPFLVMSSITGLLFWYIKPVIDEDTTTSAGASPRSGKDVTGATIIDKSRSVGEESIVEALQIDNVRIEIGYGLLNIVNNENGLKLTDQIKALRLQMARDLGFVMPSVRIQDNIQLSTNVYVIKIKDIECGRGELKPEMLLVMNPTGQSIELLGELTKEPAFGLPAMWVEPHLKGEALIKNYTVIEPSTVITTHLTEIIKDNIVDLLTYSETQKLLDEIGESNRKLVSEIIPSQVSIATLQRVLQQLLAELVSIKDLPTILEAMNEVTKNNSNVNVITEYVRSRLARQISHQYTSPDGYIHVVLLAPAWELMFKDGIKVNGDNTQFEVMPSQLQNFVSACRNGLEKAALQGESPVLLVSPAIRPYVRSVVERLRSTLAVISQNEVHAKAKLKTVGQIE